MLFLHLQYTASGVTLEIGATVLSHVDMGKKREWEKLKQQQLMGEQIAPEVKGLFAKIYLGRGAALFCWDMTRNDTLLEQSISHKRIFHKH